MRDKTVVLALMIFVISVAAEETQPRAIPKPIKQTIDGRKLKDKTVSEKKIDASAASANMILTADGAGGAFWNAGEIVGNLVGNVSGTAANVTGVVAIANGGTGSSTQSFVDLTTNQSVAGNKSFTGIVSVSSTFAVEPRPSSTGMTNLFVGKGAGAANTAGTANTFIGEGAGSKNNVGNFGTFIGLGAGQNNTGGLYNTFVGATAGNDNSGGSSNNFFGTSAGFKNISGSFNTFLGDQAGELNTTAGDSTFVGASAGFNSNGAGNTFVGHNAGFSNATESNNTLIGNNASGAAGKSNSTAVGANASVTASNSLVLGSINGINGATADTSVGIGVTAPNSALQVNGSFSLPIRTSTGNAILTAADYTLVMTSAGSTVTLPTAIGISGRIYVIKNRSNNLVSVVTTANQTIDGVAPAGVGTGAAVVVQSDGANWIKIN